MLELRNFPLWSALLRVECFVAVKSALETHTVITGVKNSGASSCLYTDGVLKCAGASCSSDACVLSQCASGVKTSCCKSHYMLQMCIFHTCLL